MGIKAREISSVSQDMLREPQGSVQGQGEKCSCAGWLSILSGQTRAALYLPEEPKGPGGWWESRNKDNPAGWAGPLSSWTLPWALKAQSLGEGVLVVGRMGRWNEVSQTLP